MTMPKGFSPKARRKARVFALQALYQWNYTQSDLNELETQYLVTNNHHRAEWGYFSELVHGVPQHLSELDQEIQAAVDRPLAELSPIELLILRLALFELKQGGIHPNIVMDEYIDIAHEYGTEEGYRFINGVLHKISQSAK